MHSIDQPAAKLGARALALATLVLTAAYSGAVQSSNLLLNQAPDEFICAEQDGHPSAALTDGDLETLWRVNQQVAPCHFVYRFDVPIAVGSVTLHNDQGEAAATPSSRATIWASHQSFGRAYFRLAQEPLNAQGPTTISFDEPILMRTLKVAIENDAPFSGRRLTASLAEIEIQTVPLTQATRWPMPLPGPFEVGDPLTLESATRCDELAGHLFNPDSYGFGRTDDDIDVAEALVACREAVARAPESTRLAYQLARVEAIAEYQVQSVARLASPLLETYPPAMLELALALREGRGVAQNGERADALISAAGEAGYLPALFEIAQRDEQAYSRAVIAGEEPETSSLSPSLERLMDASYVPAYQLYNTHLLRTDPAGLQAFMPRLEEAAEFGEPGILPQHLYNDQHGIPRDQPRAVRWILDTAWSDQDPDNLGNLSIGASWLLNDSRMAMRAARMGAYSGESWPVQQLANRGGGAGASELLEFSYREALREAEAGNAASMFQMAEMLIEGRGVEQNREEAAHWIRLSASAGDARAIDYLQSNPWSREP